MIQACNRLGEIALERVHESEQPMGAGEIRFDANGAFVTRNCLGDIAFFAISVAKIEIGVGIFLPEPDRPVVIGDGAPQRDFPKA